MIPLVSEIFSSTDVSCAALFEKHIFNSFLDGKATENDVILQLQEFDMMKAGEILSQNKDVFLNNKIEELTAFYKECITFTNWKIGWKVDKTDKTYNEMVEELRNLKSISDKVDFLLGILKIRILYLDFDESGLSDKQYVLAILNPGSMVGEIMRQGLFDDDVDELADAIMDLK